MIYSMHDHDNWISDVFSDAHSPNAVLRAHNINEAIAYNRIRKVLVARWHIFRIFVEMAKSHNGGALPDNIKHSWLLFQLLPSVLIDSMDPFLAFINACLWCRLGGAQRAEHNQYRERPGP
jgi:hypothetical protein